MIKSFRSFIHMLTLDLSECETYCRMKRYERYQKYGGRVRYLRLHTLAHHILMPILKITTRQAGWKLKILRDDRKKTDRPIIFCPTHIGGLDAEMAFLAIQTQCWLVLGDPRELYKDPAGMMLQMNGWIPLDEIYKTDREAAKAQMKALLEAGGNLLLFPEGAYNVSPNLLLNHLFVGAVELAIVHQAEIIPMAFERHDGTYYCVIGKNLSYRESDYNDRFHLTFELRDRMATLKWEIIEQLPQQKRGKMTEKAYLEFLREVITTNYDYTYTVDDISKEQFHPKDITSPQEAFASIASIKKITPYNFRMVQYAKKICRKIYENSTDESERVR